MTIQWSFLAVANPVMLVSDHCLAVILSSGLSWMKLCSSDDHCTMAKSLKVCITWKVVGLLEFYVFRGYKNINMLLVIVYNQHVYLVIHSFVFSKELFYWELPELALPYTSKSPLLDGLHHMVFTGFYTNWNNVFWHNQRKAEILWSWRG